MPDCTHNIIITQSPSGTILNIEIVNGYWPDDDLTFGQSLWKIMTKGATSECRKIIPPNWTHIGEAS